MRFLLVLIAVMFAGCGGPSESSSNADDRSTDDMETAADGLQESIDTSLNKAEAVEDVLQDAADARDAAIDAESNGT